MAEAITPQTPIGVRLVYGTHEPINETDGTYVDDITSPYTITGLTNGTRYHVKLFTYNQKGRFTDSQDKTVVPAFAKVDDVSGASITTTPGTQSVVIKWSDPNDKVQDGETVAVWEGTKVMRKAGSAPTSIDDEDATEVVDNKTRNQYSSTGYTDSGLTYGETYYYRFFPYTIQGAVTDGSSVNATPDRASVAVPTFTATMTYTSSQQTATFTGYDSSKMTVSGNTGTNAGSYTAKFNVKADYKWSDGTREEKSVSWSIGKKSVTCPTLSGTYTYTGSSQSVTISAYSSSEVTVGGDTSATNAGTYTVTFGLVDTDNLKWSDNTSAQKSATWTINKANGNVTLSSSSVTLNSSSSSATVTISGATGNVSLSSSATSVATVSPASLTAPGGTITISGVNQTAGSATITVSVAASANYKATSKAISVTAEFSAIVTFANGTDSQIKAMLDAYYNNEITWQEMGWAVGDTRKIHLNSMTAPNPNSSTNLPAQDITVVIVAHDHTDLATSINGHSKACITVQTREALHNNTARYGQPGHIFVDGSSSYDTTFTKWSNLYMRTYINDKVLGAITYSTGKGSSTSFKGMIKKSKHYRHTGYNTTSVESVTDTLFLPSAQEIFGSTSSQYYEQTNPTEGTQFDYYKTSANRIKHGNNNGSPNSVTQDWWTGSTSKAFDSTGGYGWTLCDIYGSLSRDWGNGSWGLAPAWAM